jgi:hypothetical protein
MKSPFEEKGSGKYFFNIYDYILDSNNLALGRIFQARQLTGIIVSKCMSDHKAGES